jgi:hypothetical protein
MVEDLRRQRGLVFHFVREGMVLDDKASASDQLRWDFAVMGAKSYVLSLSENVRRSLEYKKRNGEWSGKAPLGYLNARDANGKSTLVRDPERAFLIKRLLEEYAAGSASISGDLVRKARQWGLTNKTGSGRPLTAAQIHTMLHNPFYSGDMVINGQPWPHKYERLITRELFDQCQSVSNSRTRASTVRYSEKPFVFRGLLRCASRAAASRATSRKSATSI